MTVGELGAASLLLAVASVFDVGWRRIPNSVTVALAASGAFVAFWNAGLAAGATALAAGAAVFAALLPAWRIRALGGGDLKLAVACAVWVGFHSLVRFTLAAALAGGVVSLACWVASAPAVRREVLANLQLAARRAMPPVTIQQPRGRVSVPYGAAIAAAAVWTLWTG